MSRQFPEVIIGDAFKGYEFVEALGYSAEEVATNGFVRHQMMMASRGAGLDIFIRELSSTEQTLTPEGVENGNSN